MNYLLYGPFVPWNFHSTGHSFLIIKEFMKLRYRASIVALTGDRFSDLFSGHYCKISRDLM